MPAPMRCERQSLFGGQSVEIGPVTLAGVDDRQSRRARGGQHPRGRFEAGPGQVQVVAHRVDVATRARRSRPASR